MSTASTSSSSSTSAPMTASEIRARVRRQKVDPRVSLDVYFRTAEHVHLQVRARSRRARDALATRADGRTLERARAERERRRRRREKGTLDWIGTRRRLTERERRALATRGTTAPRD